MSIFIRLACRLNWLISSQKSVIAYDRRQFAKQQGAFERLTSDITTIDDSGVNSSASDNFAVVAAQLQRHSHVGFSPIGPDPDRGPCEQNFKAVPDKHLRTAFFADQCITGRVTVTFRSLSSNVCYEGDMEWQRSTQTSFGVMRYGWL